MNVPFSHRAVGDRAVDRYFHIAAAADIDPISGERPKMLRYGVGGTWKTSASGKSMPCYDPSTGSRGATQTDRNDLSGSHH
ncbi:MAG TPA: hypothetical protein VIJ35_16965 [Bradyrhizobium sp.]